MIDFLFQSKIKLLVAVASVVVLGGAGTYIASNNAVNTIDNELIEVERTPTPEEAQTTDTITEKDKEVLGESIDSLTSSVKEKLFPTPTPIPTATPTPAPKTTSNTPSIVIPNTQPKTYPIVPISVMNIASMEPHLQVIAQKAYQEFLKTPNLNQLDESNQIEILVGIYARMLREEINTTQQNISQLKQENKPTPTPFYSVEIENALAQLNQTLTNISNQPVAMNVVEGRRQRAYQDWVNANQSIYSTIASTHYKNNLNAILVANGLSYYVIK